jgi:hypothetical protein
MGDTSIENKRIIVSFTFEILVEKPPWCFERRFKKVKLSRAL